MPFPTGMLLRTVTLPVVRNAAGGFATGTLHLQAASALKWEPTGEIILQTPIALTLVNGTASIALPPVQDGLLTIDNAEVVTFTYSAALGVPADSSSIGTINFTLLVSPSGAAYALDFNEWGDFPEVVVRQPVPVVGTAGQNGVNGTNGIDGVNGVDGAQGPPGPITTFTVDQVTSNSTVPSFVVKGTAPNLQIDVNLPKGDPGAAGGAAVNGVEAGGTAGQYYTKQSGADYDGQWTDLPVVREIPAGGTDNQVLTKQGTTDYVVGWEDLPAPPPALPTGGTATQFLGKVSGTDYDVAWEDLPAPPANPLPVGGAAGAVLKKVSTADFDVAWAADEVGGGGGGGSAAETVLVGVGDGVTDNAAAFVTAVNTANGNDIYLPDGDFLVLNAQIGDQDVRTVGPGRLLQGAVPILTMTRTLGATRAVSSIGSIALGVAGTDIDRCSKIVASVAGVTQGDVLHLSSNDRYAFSDDGTSGVYKADYVPVHGIGMEIGTITNGGVASLDTILGMTSGATATIFQVTTVGAARILVANKVTGTFVVGEAVRVGGAGGTNRGTITEAPYIIMAGQLLDTYPTSPTIRTTSKAVCELNVRVAAAGDPYTIVGNAARKPAIIIRGQIDGDVHVRADSSWTRLVRLEGCFGVQLSGRARNLPSIAETSEQGYGYMFEIFGLSRACRVHDAWGRNIRHIFTTNTTSNTSLAAALASSSGYYGIGVPKFNDCDDSVVVDPIASGFDTHDWAYFTSFKGCTVIDHTPGGRFFANSGAFQNRGFGTSYEDCRSFGGNIGFNDGITDMVAPFANLTRYKNCMAEGFRYAGFHQPNVTNVSAGLSRYSYTYCEAIANRSTDYGIQYGFAIDDTHTTLHGCISRMGATGVPFRLNSKANSKLRMINCTADYSTSSGANNGMRFDGSVASTVEVMGYTVIGRDDGLRPTSAFRFYGTGQITLKTDGFLPINAPTATLYEVNSGGATPSIQIVGRVTGQTAGGSIYPPGTPLIQRKVGSTWPAPLTTDPLVPIIWLGEDPGPAAGVFRPGIDLRFTEVAPV